MKRDKGYYIWNKGEKADLTQYFTTLEFECSCSFPDCKEQKISEDLISKLNIIRGALQKPMSVNSGFRCNKYQVALSDAGKQTAAPGTSTHEKGDAADVWFKSLRFDEWSELCRKYFNSYGIASNFVHVDIRPKKADGSFRIWSYK